jgi:circadian clock protein KaiC
MSHSNQLREFLLTDHGIEILDVYVGPEGVLTGSLRLSQEARERAEGLVHQQELEARQRERKRKREALEARIAALRKEFEADESEAQLEIEIQQNRATVVSSDRERMAKSRRSDARGINNDKTPVSTNMARGKHK